jgi:4-hydroxyacetophenone monooxygenase
VNATNCESLQIHELEDITKSANVPTLLMVIYQVTGDERWLAPPYQPTRTKGLSDHDSGGLPDSIQAEIRHAAAQAFHHLREGRPPAIAVPTPEQMATMLGVCVGESVDDSYGLMFSQEFGRRVGAAESASPRPASVPGDYRVLIIGAGVSGIIAAQRMQEMGLSYLLVDKHDAPGGNWLDNRYPGVGVDTPSHLYSYSFAPHDWGYHFELRESLEDYFGKAFDLVGARPNTRFRTAVVRTEYDEEAARWLVTLRAADGTLEVLAFRGKRVAVIGSGASAMQIVPAIADQVDQLTIFQRTPPWVAPFEKFLQPIDEDVRYLLRTYPIYRAWYWLKLYWQFGDKILDSLRKDPEWPHPERAVNARNDGHREFFTQYIRDELGDRTDLFEQVLPTYPPYGKRILLDNGWYQALCKPNVTLVTEAVESVTSTGVVTQSGSPYDVDVLVWATGFEASQFVSSLEVVGRGGVTLRDTWDGDDARAYLGVSVPGFPNFFMVGGPNSFPGSGSFMYFMEVQMGYIARLLGDIFKTGAAAIEVRKDVFDEYNDLVDRTAELTVWTHLGTNTYFRNSRGRLVFVSPFRNVEYWTRASQSSIEDYEVLEAGPFAHAGVEPRLAGE